jgi:hypothetical protein
MSTPVSNTVNSPIVVTPPLAVSKEIPSDVSSIRRPVGLQSTKQQEDTVTLSSRQPSSGTPENHKKPSQPVSPDEKKSLLGTKKSEHSFSVYG